MVLGFPADDVAGQEPRSDEEIAEFCEANFGVSFPMFAKSNVVAEPLNPVFARLAAAAGPPTLELQQVPPRPRRRGGRALRGRDRARRPGAQRDDREAPRQLIVTLDHVRNIRTLHTSSLPPPRSEVHDAALQYVRKISGSTEPSQANAEAFERAVEEVAAATTEAARRPGHGGSSQATVEVEAAKRRARAAERYATA